MRHIALQIDANSWHHYPRLSPPSHHPTTLAVRVCESDAGRQRCGSEGRSRYIYIYIYTYIYINVKKSFCLYGRWGGLDICKRLPQGVRTFCPPGKPILRRSIFRSILLNFKRIDHQSIESRG